MATLRDLLLDLGQEAEVYRDYIADPMAVMSRYDLSEEEINAMLAKDLEAIKRLSGMDNVTTNHTLKAYDAG